MHAINQKAAKAMEELTRTLKTPGDHISIENEPYTRLVLENIGEVDCANGKGQLISMAHYPTVDTFEDPLVDPEICFIKCVNPVVRKIKGKHQVVEEVQYFPYYIKYLTGKEFTYVTFEEDGWHYFRYAFFSQKELAEFAGLWCNNIKEQGFLEVKPLPKKLPVYGHVQTLLEA